MAVQSQGYLAVIEPRDCNRTVQPSSDRRNKVKTLTYLVSIFGHKRKAPWTLKGGYQINSWRKDKPKSALSDPTTPQHNVKKLAYNPFPYGPYVAKYTLQ